MGERERKIDRGHFCKFHKRNKFELCGWVSESAKRVCMHNNFRDGICRRRNWKIPFLCVFFFFSLSHSLRVLNLQCSVQNYDHLGYFIAFLTSSRIEWRENKWKQISWRRLYNAIFKLKRSLRKSLLNPRDQISLEFFFRYMEPLCNIRSTFSVSFLCLKEYQMQQCRESFAKIKMAIEHQMQKVFFCFFLFYREKL